MPKTLTLYAQRFPASHRWLVEERVDEALAEIKKLPEWTGDLHDGECIVLVQVVAHNAQRSA